MGIIRSIYGGTGIGAPYPRVFFQCFNGWEPMSNKLWSHGLDSIYHDVHPKARVEIPTGNDGELFIDYLTTNGRRIRIIGQYSVNRSVQFTGFPEVWGSNMPYIYPIIPLQIKTEGGVGLGQTSTALFPLPMEYGV